MQAFQSSEMNVVGFTHSGNGPNWSSDDMGDLANLNREIGGFDCLINLAAPPAEADAESLAQNTTIALAALGDALKLEIPAVFLVSSAAVYGDPTANARLKETTAATPISDYGRSKLAMERAVQNWRTDNPDAPLKATCLRVGNVAGADRLLVNVLKEMPLRLDQYSDGTSLKRSYIGPLTLAAILTSLCEAGKDLPALLNIAAPRPVFMADLLTAANCNWLNQPAPNDAIKSVCLDTTALGAFHTFIARDSEPAELIRQWHACEAK
jgi:UDP-glucose 4-epimerase